MSESTNNFLGNMQTVVVGKVVSLTKYEIDNGAKGGSIWLTKPNTGRNPNVLGDEIIKIRIPFDMFEQQRQKLELCEIQIPGLFEIVAEIDMGGGNKATLTALSMRPYKPDALDTKPEQLNPTTTQLSEADKTQSKDTTKPLFGAGNKST